MGTVYRAVHPELERTVAIKVLALGLSQSDDIVRRFRVEARAVNRIRHPNVVDVQDFGTLPDGRPYYIMEFLAGESLGHYLGRVGPLPARDALVIMLPVTEALDAAHTAGVVHRDLKPDNIFLLARDGAPPTPKLLDFGIAKVLSETISGGTARTQSGSVMGTPLYMSPEQAGGRVDELGTASDVYSLGVILYQMLSGSTPFDAPGFGELLVMHMQHTPPPLSSRIAGVPRAMEDLVMRMLAKPPSERPPNASAVRRELGAIAASLSMDATRPLERSPTAPTLIAPAIAVAAAASRPPGMTSPSKLVGEVAARTEPVRGKTPWLAIGGVAAIGAGALVWIATRGGGAPAPQPAVSPPPIAQAIDAAPPPPPPPPDAAPPPPDAAPPPPPDAAAPQSELERRMEALKHLYDDGVIDQTEYERRRKKLLEEL